MKLSCLWAVFLVVVSMPLFGDPKIKVGFIYVSDVASAGWSAAHDTARRSLEAELGDMVQTTAIPNVSEGSDAERVLRRLAQDHELIFATSFGYMNAMTKVARRFPGVRFEHATGYGLSPNLGNYQVRTYQGRYLNGIIAGGMTKTGIIGYVAPFPIPEVVRDVNAYMLGIHSVNPDAVLQVIWTSSWNDPAKEREATDSLVRQGVDVVSHHTDGTSVVQAAEAAGIWSNAYNTDMVDYGPKTQLSAVVLNWLPFYREKTLAIINDQWTSESLWWGLAEGVVEIESIHPKVPEALVIKMNEARERIKKEDDIFKGPLRDQAGNLRVAVKEAIDDETLLKLDWFVEGVRSRTP
ncbi:MAG: basic membrane protein A [Candidatus Azotimanducaceae bacterium]|jgi:basic membrane protein A